MAKWRSLWRRWAIWGLAFLVLVACCEAGGFIAKALALPVPGTVIGLLILLGGLFALRRVPDALNDVSVYLLGHLNLLYVPAGVGVLGYVTLVAHDFWPIIVTMFASTFLATLAAGLAFRWMAEREARDE